MARKGKHRLELDESLRLDILIPLAALSGSNPTQVAAGLINRGRATILELVQVKLGEGLTGVQELIELVEQGVNLPLTLEDLKGKESVLKAELLGSASMGQE